MRSLEGHYAHRHALTSVSHYTYPLRLASLTGSSGWSPLKFTINSETEEIARCPAGEVVGVQWRLDGNLKLERVVCHEIGSRHRGGMRFC